MTIFEYKFYFIFNLTIQLNNLGLFRLNNKRSLRLELMNYLNKIGYSNRKIKDFLNVSNIKRLELILNTHQKMSLWVLRNINKD